MPDSRSGQGDPALEANAELLRALGHAVRLQILTAIKDAELSVGEIEEATGISQPGLSQQLSILRKVDLVETRRTGKQVFYQVDSERMRELEALLGALAGPAGTVHTDAPPRQNSGGASAFARVFR